MTTWDEPQSLESLLREAEHFRVEEDSSAESLAYVLYGQDLGQDLSLGDLQRAQYWLRAVVASSIRVSMLQLTNTLSNDPFRPLSDPLAPTATAGPLPVRASVYGNPWWEVVQTLLPYATAVTMAAVLRNTNRLIDIGVRLSTLGDERHARRRKLLAEAERSKLDEMRALAEQAKLGSEVRWAHTEGRDVRAELRRRGNVNASKQVEEGVAAETLFRTVADIPAVSIVAPPIMKVIEEDDVREAAEAVREAAAAQELPAARDPSSLSASDDENAQELGE
jgi:hypothetical protein